MGSVDVGCCTLRTHCNDVGRAGRENWPRRSGGLAIRVTCEGLVSRSATGRVRMCLPLCTPASPAEATMVEPAAAIICARHQPISYQHARHTTARLCHASHVPGAADWWRRRRPCGCPPPRRTRWSTRTRRATGPTSRSAPSPRSRWTRSCRSRRCRPTQCNLFVLCERKVVLLERMVITTHPRW